MDSSQPAINKAQYHRSDCKCCVCRMKRIAPSASPAANLRSRKLKPCICGSVVCKKDWNDLKREQRHLQIQKKMHFKRCLCGSNVCGEESQKMPELLLEAAKQADNEKFLAKQAVINEKLYQKARKKRIKDREKALEAQKILQRADDKRQMKYVKKSQNAGDLALITESLIDLGTFGSKAFCDIAKYVYKGFEHPRDVVQDMRDAVMDPRHVAKVFKKNADGIGLQGTLDRIKKRAEKMPVAKALVTKMEAYPATNYLIHIADKDPKRRMKAFKTRRYREPRDFQCSPYMASMRKRPCLRIYYMCPWFYPHFMGLLQVWKQFIDILLFILAVAVWSPCILFMELCRGFLCCFMCQG